LSVSDEGYSRNVSWALDLIATFESLIGIGQLAGHRKHMTTDVNPFRDETTHAQFQLMKNYNFNNSY
jgi:hypothetical protein